MKQSGFTLVELIATIVVIGLIAMFALPQVLNQYSNHTEELSQQQLDLISESARTYVLDNASKYPKTTDSYCITLEEMVNDGALDSGFVRQTLGDDYNDAYHVVATYKGSAVSIQVVEGKCS